jgi:Ca2+-binding RTX toxin-like protein
MATAPADDVAGALKSIDASATTGGVNLYAGTSDAIGTNGNSKNTVYTGLSITGGSGNDAIRNDAKGGTINGGAGDDWLVSGGAGQTLTGGAGSDRLVTTNGSIGVVLTGGEGTDTFDVTAAAFGASSTTSAAAVVVTVADLSAGDKIVGLTKTDGLFGAKVSLSTATSLDTAITEALTGVSAATTVWFQYGGNTYLVESSDNALGSGDTVVKLSGLVDLSTSTVASNVITFG